MSVLVIGTAHSGRAAIALLLSAGKEVIAYDDDLQAVHDLPVPARGGGWGDELLDGVDLVVVSPGVPERAASIQSALRSGLEVISEIELGSRAVDCPILAVTGTNGKTTVTEIAAQILIASGLRATAVGNIGSPLSAAVGEPWDVLVVETSSFQLRFIDTFHPHVAVLLNVAPDHLDWHQSFDDYLAAKARIHENQGPEDVIIYDGGDPGAVQAVAGARARKVAVGTAQKGGAAIDGDKVWMGDIAVPLHTFPKRDPVLILDFVAAATAALELGATREGIVAVAGTYQAGAHRRQEVGTWGGVTWVNDSKATNPHATRAAVAAYRSVVLIAGGRNKGLDVTGLWEPEQVRAVVAFGESAHTILEGSGDAGRLVADLGEAISVAAALARPGDTVLFSPACASFDMFDDYRARGDAFVRLVGQRVAV